MGSGRLTRAIVTPPAAAHEGAWYRRRGSGGIKGYAQWRALPHIPRQAPRAPRDPGDPRPLGRELELHHLASAMEYDAFTAGLVRHGLYAIALYMLSRPRFETLGWTVNIEEPRRNLFLAGSAGDGP